MRVYFIVLLSLWCCSAFAQQDEQKLEALQSELKERQQALADSQASAEELQEVLKQSELEISRVARTLEQTREALTANEKEQSTLKQTQSTLRQAILNQQDMLASQLRSAFMAGHYDYAKMLFYQDDARKFERVVTYYQYLSKARQQAITEFRDNVEELKAVNARLAEKAQELTELLAAQQTQRANLVARQQDRQATLAKLNKKIASDNERIAQLRQSEQALIQAIEEAQRRAERETQTLSGLAGVKGKLAAPVDGRVRRLFGLRRQGQLRWKGIVIESNEGSAVKVVSGGRVLYADWLRGFGLVTIVDHGKGYMSVYGHNQALLKQSGDNVSTGDTIALVGQSGGQSYPNLYFEIRHKGKALNPSKWLDL